jgi:hypothetical protein
VQVGLVLEEVEVAPLLIGGVVDRALHLPLRAGEPSSAGKADVNVEPMPIRIEVEALYFPWRREPEGNLFELASQSQSR